MENAGQSESPPKILKCSRPLRKGKKQNLENAGQLESTPKLLKCSYPYSSSVDFKVELGFCDNGWKYNLNFDVCNKYIISRHNSEKHFVLNHNKYEITLKQWLEKKENQYNWCDYYEKQGLYRPKEEAKKVIRGILRAVYELHHSHNSFHGFLHHLENFAIQDNEMVIGGDHEKNKHIFLIHENDELKQHFTNNRTQLDDKQWDDRRALSNVIFTQILGGRQKPQDLEDLHNLLLKFRVTAHDWNLIVNHPSLWHWKSRFGYIDCVWMHFKHADENSFERDLMKSESNKINVMDWKKNIPPNSPLEIVYNNRIYNETAEDLIRFIRNVRTHYKEHVKSHHATEYNEPQFIEGEITKLDELFLVKLYQKDILYQTIIEI